MSNRFLGTALVLATAYVLLPEPARGEPSSKVVLAVFEIEIQAPKVSNVQPESLTTYLEGKLAEHDGFALIPTASIRKALQERKAESYAACVDDSCQIEIGRELAAQKTLRSQIVELGDRCAIVTTLYDLRTAASERAVTERIDCTGDAISQGLDRVAFRFSSTDRALAPVPNVVTTQPAEVERSSVLPVLGSISTVLAVGAAVTGGVETFRWVRASNAGDDERAGIDRGVAIGCYIGTAVFAAGAALAFTAD